jgi:hypothetical protein
LRPVATDAEVVKGAKIATQGSTIQNPVKDMPSTALAPFMHDEILRSPLGATSIKYLSQLPASEISVAVRSLFVNLM